MIASNGFSRAIQMPSVPFVHDIDGETFGLEPFPQPGGQALLVFDHQ